MENGSIGSRLRARWYLVLIAAVVSCAVGLSGEYTVGHSGLKSKDRPQGVGSAQLLVDSKPSTLATLSLSSDEKALDARAPLYAEYATGTAVKTRIAQLAGVPFDSLTVFALTNQVTPRTSSANPPVPSTGHFVTLTATAQSAVIRITSVAKKTSVAEKLAAATATALRQSVARLAASEHFTPTTKTKTKTPIVKIILRPLGAPTGSTVLRGGSAKKSIAYGVVAFIIFLILIVLLDNLLLGRAARRRARTQVAAP